MNLIINTSIILGVLAGLFRYFSSAGNDWGKTLIGFPFLLGPILLLSLLTARRQLELDNKQTVIARVSFLGCVVGVITGLLFPLLNQSPFYMQYFAADLLIFAWIYTWISQFEVVASPERVLLIGKMFKIYVGLNFLIFFVNIFFFEVTNTLHLLVPSLTLAYLTIQAYNTQKSGADWLKIITAFAMLAGLVPHYVLGYHRISVFGLLMIIGLSAILSFGGVLKTRLARVGGLSVVVMAVVYVGLNSSVDFESSLAGTRFYSTLVQREALSDESSESRIFEARDCVAELTENFPASVLGFGHGSCYSPVLSPVLSNETQEGYIHNIHVGIVLLSFRYGVLGVMFYLLYLQLILRGFNFLRRNLKVLADDPNRRQVALAYVAAFYLISAFFMQFHAQNISIEPLFGIALGLVCYMVKDKSGGPVALVDSNHENLAELEALPQ